MRLLASSFFSESWFLVVILVVAVVLLMVSNFIRRKKEETFRQDLEQKVVKGAKVKTYSGIYGTVVSVRSTTDGKIVLIQTGEGEHVSYQTIHFNAIFGLDESEDLVLDKDGNEVTREELAEQLKAEETASQTNEEVTEVVEAEPVVEEAKPEKPKKSKK